MVSVGVSIVRPLFAKHRQDPIIAARAEQANSARLEREATARAVRAQLDADLAEHRAHHERYMRATNTLVPLAEQRAELDRASYAAGRIDLGTALRSEEHTSELQSLMPISSPSSRLKKKKTKPH